MHDGEDRFKEKLRHIDPLRLHVLDWIKDDTDDESPNDLTGFHHLVEDGLVPVLFARHLPLPLASQEADALGAFSLQVDPSLSAA